MWKKMIKTNRLNPNCVSVFVAGNTAVVFGLCHLVILVDKSVERKKEKLSLAYCSVHHKAGKTYSKSSHDLEKNSDSLSNYLIKSSFSTKVSDWELIKDRRSTWKDRNALHEMIACIQ